MLLHVALIIEAEKKAVSDKPLRIWSFAASAFRPVRTVFVFASALDDPGTDSLTGDCCAAGND